MSDTKAFAVHTYTQTEFISLEHGTKNITLTIYRSRESMCLEMLPTDARLLAEDLLRRANEIESKKEA